MKLGLALFMMLSVAHLVKGGQVTVHAVLMSPLTTAFSQKGDLVSAKITDPPEWKGAILEGQVQTVQRNSGNKHSVIQFTLQVLHQGSKSSQVSVSLLKVANSKAEKDHDDEGVVVTLGSEAEHKSGHHLGLGRDHSSGDKNGSSGPIRLTSAPAPSPRHEWPHRMTRVPAPAGSAAARVARRRAPARRAWWS